MRLWTSIDARQSLMFVSRSDVKVQGLSLVSHARHRALALSSSSRHRLLRWPTSRSIVTHYVICAFDRLANDDQVVKTATPIRMTKRDTLVIGDTILKTLGLGDSSRLALIVI